MTRPSASLNRYTPGCSGMEPGAGRKLGETLRRGTAESLGGVTDSERSAKRDGTSSPASRSDRKKASGRSAGDGQLVPGDRNLELLQRLVGRPVGHRAVTDREAAAVART